MLTPRLTSSNSREPSTTDPIRSRVVEALNTLARFSLLLVLIAAPWIFGGVQTHVQFTLYLGVVVSLTFWIFALLWGSMTTGSTFNRLPLMIAPLLAGLALGAYQLSEHHQASGSQRRNASTANLAAGEEPTKTSLIESLKPDRTISPASTRFVQDKLIFAIATFLLAAQLFATSASQLWLWGAFALNGSTLAFFGITQQLSWNGRLFWTIPLPHDAHPFSSFINRNNAAGYLCICLAAALGLLLAALKNRWPSEQIEGLVLANRRRGFETRNGHVFTLFQSVVQLSAIQLASVAMVILIATAIILTASRGGSLALVAAIVITSLAASRSRGLSVVAFVGVAGLVTAGLIALTDHENRIAERWNSIVSTDAIAGDVRWSHWTDSLKVVRDFPLTGTGYGTYQFAYLPYQTHPKIAHLRFYHADNQFIEWLVEGGFVGFSLVLRHGAEKCADSVHLGDTPVGIFLVFVGYPYHVFAPSTWGRKAFFRFP